MKLQNQIAITCNCITPWEYFAVTILQVTTNEPPGTRERAPGSTEPPENPSTQTEHPSNQEEKATAQGITPRRLRRYGKRKPPEESPQAINITYTLRILRKLM